MPRFAANISMLYPEHPLLARIGAAARDGFAAVEVQAPYAATAEEFARSLREARVELVLMNAPPATPTPASADWRRCRDRRRASTRRSTRRSITRARSARRAST